MIARGFFIGIVVSEIAVSTSRFSSKFSVSQKLDNSLFCINNSIIAKLYRAFMDKEAARA